MAITAAALGSLLTTQADYNYYIQQQMYWQDKYEANSAKLEEQVKYETKWEKAFDDAKEADKDLKLNGRVFITKGQNVSDDLADEYAHRKVEQYDEELSLELADLDIEYETMKTMYDTLVQKLQAEKDAEKQLVSTCAQDNGTLGQ